MVLDRRTTAAAVIIPAVAISVTLGVIFTSYDDRQAIPEIVEIGALLPSTGGWSGHGSDNILAARLATDDFNAYLESAGESWRMRIIVEDTQTDPAVALEKLQSFDSRGIKMIVGAETSAELEKVKPYADSNGMILISPSSVSPALSVTDGIFRLIPDDTNQAKALAALLYGEGIKAVVTVYRGDVWGHGLSDSVGKSFQELGGAAHDSIQYAPDASAFTAVASLLSENVSERLSAYEADEVAVLAIGFSEVISLFHSADQYELLHSVRWFGSDASSNDSSIVSDERSSRFTSNVSFTTTQFAVAGGDRYERVQTHIINQTGSPPGNFAYASYDAVWLFGLAILAVGSPDVQAVAEELPLVAADYDGAVGHITFNEYGDLTAGDYDIFVVSDGAWEPYATYDSTTGQIIPS